MDAAEIDPGRLAALADLISAAGVAALVPGAAEILGDGPVRQSRLLNRFRRLQGEKWAACLNNADVPAVAIKGLSTAHTVWPDPDSRAVSDADLLVKQKDLWEAVRILSAEGFTVAEMPTRSPWGFVGDASFQPLIGPGDSSNIDLHVEGDSWPFTLALTAEEIVRDARFSADSSLLTPDPAHQFLIAASHAAGDLFTSDAVKSVVDGLLMLNEWKEEIAFPDILRRCQRAHMAKPVSVFLALLEQLGGDCSTARAAGFDLDRYSGAAFREVVTAHNRMFEDAPALGHVARLKREAALSAEARVLLWRNCRRLTGLVRPRTGRLPVESR